MTGILVAVDGSDHSRRALGWAMREALQRHAPLTVVIVRPPEARPATEIYWGLHALRNDSADLEHTRAAVRELVDKVASELGETVPDISVDVVIGDPGAELVRASHDSDLLVVGSRGNGGFARLLLGSVCSKVTHHAACAVAVIPEARRLA